MGTCLGAEPITVLPLSGERLKYLDEATGRERAAIKELEVVEGEVHKREAEFRSRNRSLILAKKTNSDGCCEVCDFNFSETYGLHDKDCLVAHHLVPIGKRKGPTKTALSDIALLCPNCHAMVHTKNQPIPPYLLRRKVR